MTIRFRAALIRRFASERGSALIVAIVVLLAVTTLAMVAVATASQTNLSTRHDANYKNAAEAAEAGLQIALYRLNMLGPGNSSCVGDALSAPASNGWCQSSAYTLGNGSSYQYYMTPVMAQGASCIGVTITNTDVNQRCITAVGISNGVTDRAQIRSSAFAAQPLLPVSGSIGLSGITLSGSAKLTGASGTNGQYRSSGSASSNGVELGPAGSDSDSSSTQSTPVTHLSSPLVLDPVNPGTSNQSSLAYCPARQAAGYPACNDDYRITNGLASPRVSPYDQSSPSGVSFNATNRALVVSGNGSLTLGGGVYNFCSVTLSGGGSVTIAPGTMAEIFIDSPDDPGSGCPANSGNLVLSGGSTWFNPSQNPLAAQFYVYGLNNGSSTITLSGNSAMYGVIYAPQDQVTLSGNGTLYGSIAASKLTVSGNGGTSWDSRLSTLQATPVGLYYRTGWAQCSPTSTQSQPGAGCG
jgi:Tfp pilus assembly protein PilX